MLLKRILAYFIAKKESKAYEWRPPYYPNEGTWIERRKRLLEERLQKFREAERIYWDYEEAGEYLEALWQRVQDAESIKSYEDWENEYVKEEVPLPNINLNTPVVHLKKSPTSLV